MTRFKMFRITVDQFAMLQPEFPTSAFSLSSSANVRHSIENHKIAVTMNFSIDSNDVKYMVLQLMCEFDIHPDDFEKLKTDSSTIVFPKSLIDYLIAQTVGTARGVLFCKTQGTPYAQFVLPPLNVSEMVKGDMTVKITGH